MGDYENEDLICNSLFIAIILQQWTHGDYSISCINYIVWHYYYLILDNIYIG